MLTDLLCSVWQLVRVERLAAVRRSNAVEGGAICGDIDVGEDAAAVRQINQDGSAPRSQELRNCRIRRQQSACST
jgi:hypothetical protein